MNIFHYMHSLIKTIDSVLKFNNFTKNKELIFIAVIIGFPILIRVLPVILLTTIVIIAFFFLVFLHFYKYSNKLILLETENTKTSEYSWGFVKENIKYTDIVLLFNSLKGKGFSYYKDYFLANKFFYTLLLFISADLIIAFKNLSFFESGIYFMLSLFTKFIFLAYIYIERVYSNIVNEKINQEAKEIKILDAFYKHFNGLASISIVVFLLFFILSKYIVEIFFGNSFTLYHTSLPFILFANIALLVTLMIYRTASLVDSKRTNDILKVYIPIFLILFVFIDISYYDTVAYFVIGAMSTLSIFLYNFCIRKPSYIENTYNSLF